MIADRPLWLNAAGISLMMALSSTAHAVQTCELAGQPVNPANGNTTAGKTGLMRCKDADTGLLVREQELQAGKFMGIVRYFNAGQLEREQIVNEKGNQDGRAREWKLESPGGKPVLVRETVYQDGSAVGVAREWYATGQLSRLTFYGDERREQASAEFQPDGRLGALRCAPRPVFGGDFDDRQACGHGGRPSTVELFGSKGQVTSRITFDAGERRKVENLWQSGAVRSRRITEPAGGSEEVWDEAGTLRTSHRWVTTSAPSSDGGSPRARNVDVLEQKYHETGKLTQERRWVPTDRGADLVFEGTWYLNGQPREATRYAAEGGQRTREVTSFYDNGKLASVGTWRIGTAGRAFDRSERPTGTHQQFDDQGRLRGERIYDERGRITREREIDERGAVVRDEEVFEDGSRKSMGR